MSETTLPAVRPQSSATVPPAAIPETVGRVASPPRREATSEQFFFWVAPDAMVEKTQIIRTESEIAGTTVTFYGLVREVYRQSRQSDLGEEFDRHDGQLDYQPPFPSAGFTYAEAAILRTEPPMLCPPREGSPVVIGGRHEAEMAYGADEIDPASRFAVGLVRNGGTRLAGPGSIDLDHLLGANGGHLNVTGVAGRGTKSSLLLHFNWLLIRRARQEARDRPSDRDRLRVVPVILNVKNFDLFHIDRRSIRWRPAEHAADWAELGVADPAPFEDVRFLAPQQAGLATAIDVGRPSADVKPYSWSLSDVIDGGLLTYLFAEEDVRDANFSALVYELADFLTDERTERDGRPVRRLRRDEGAPQTFRDLLDLLRQDKPARFTRHHDGTWRKLYRRLFRLLEEGGGVLRRDDRTGHPPVLTSADTAPPTVMDLSGLAAVPSLQRFVVAAVFEQLRRDRTGSAARRGLVYLVTLDELNRFAPRGSHDPVTALIETVAAEMRSQGIILLGAQQQASLVSTRVVENAGLRALGKTGAVELGDPVWRFLSEAARRKAAQLRPDEKLLVQDGFREPMLVKVPFPPWALRGQDAEPGAPAPAAGAAPSANGRPAADEFDAL
jgi:DNA helicase HerA-like ATPase